MTAWLKESVIKLANLSYNIAAKELPPLCRLPQESFRALSEYFDAIWVLSIGRNIGRRARVTKLFDEMRYKFYEGVDGKNLIKSDARIDFVQASENSGRPFLMNEAACALSHFAMYHEIVNLGLNRVLIFEDDAAPIQKSSKWIPYCLERLPEDWELLYLGYRDGELRGFLRELQESLGRRRNPSEVVSRSVGRGIRTAAGHDFTHGYAVTREGAGKLLEEAYPVRYTADGWLEQNVLQQKIKAYITIPKLFVQHADLGSSIHER